jgi:hydrogenase-4 component F
VDIRALVVVPLVGAVVAGCDPRRERRTVWLLLAATAHLALVGLAWRGRLPGSPLLWLEFDPLGGLALTLVSLVFLSVALYSVGYFRHQAAPAGRAFEVCLLGFLASASVLCLTGHFGVMWVAMETTTLATAPLLYDPHDRHSIEAVWKYLVLCSVGIALALLGTFMLALAVGVGGAPPSLARAEFMHAHILQPVWFKAAFVFLLVGYGTKAGLVPMHTWLPDAHGEAPSPISALLSGALLNCAFLAILRILQVAHVGGQDRLVAPVLVACGLLSMLVASAFLLRQTGYKRMLAYSSVEHMGVLCVGLGLGHAATYGALLHMVVAGVCKALLFFTAGNALLEYGSKRIADVSGLVRRLPISGMLFVLGFLALSGAPPFAGFASELAILQGAVAGGNTWVAVAFVGLQGIAFVALVKRVVAMAQGGSETVPPRRESPWLVLPAAGLLVVAFALGLALTGPVGSVLATTAATLGGSAP